MERRPLVVIAGRVQELPLGDSLAGASSGGEEEVAYSKRIDFVSDDQLYRAEAVPGSDESDPVWRIRKVVLASDGDVVETWAEGDANFDKIWSNRETYNYI